jgi:hypothetical protein
MPRAPSRPARSPGRPCLRPLPQFRSATGAATGLRASVNRTVVIVLRGIVGARRCLQVEAPAGEEARHHRRGVAAREQFARRPRAPVARRPSGLAQDSPSSRSMAARAQQTGPGVHARHHDGPRRRRQVVGMLARRRRKRPQEEMPGDGALLAHHGSGDPHAPAVKRLPRRCDLQPARADGRIEEVGETQFRRRRRILGGTGRRPRRANSAAATGPEQAQWQDADAWRAAATIR